MDVMPRLQRGVGRVALAMVLPLAVFYLLLRVVGPTSAIAGGMATSLLVLGIRLRSARRADPMVLVPMAIVLVQGGLAIAFDSVELYLAAPAFENIIWGVVSLGSVALGRPLGLLVVRELQLVPDSHSESSELPSALRVITIVWGLASFGKGALRLFLLNALPLEAFLVLIWVSGQIINGALISFSVWWTLRALRHDRAAAQTALE
jgi:hypothetical protein